MEYPTLPEVDAANRTQLCRWWRFLPSPGTAAINNAGLASGAVVAAIDAEAKIMDRIAERFDAAGGFTPAISKALGWNE